MASRSVWKRKLRSTITGYLFLLPTLLVIGTFLFLPVFYSLFLSFHKVNLLGDVSYKFIGFSNFERMAQDERAWIALKNTASFALFVVPLQTALALGLATILNAKLKFRNFFRIVFFMPTVTSSAVLTLIFMWIYNSNGLLNQALQAIGLPGYNWLGDPAVALKGIMLMNIWSTAPFFMVVFLAALQDIPDALYESAMLDGAGAWKRFTAITLPMLKPATFFTVVMGIIGTFQLFDQSYIFSAGSGGPNNSTLTVALLIYQYAFKNLDFGYASALAIVLALVIMIATLLQRKLFAEEKLN
ncbi:carbohydrate ABC transporter permease [Paenibacillus tyrfis]|uniref:carbohydrate ABC transporter permease n=1 Tax=Paenibacillus tyrfis TaxID=1501230 RepID=UPI0020A21D25|nr:sugar ABC transporter permease [Paenibacillus tyrfis]MCP1310282.1 sugar ABC transporter permease [Paenibacillus tyrfis]